MAQSHVKKVLDTMGCGDGSFMPLANKENQLIMEAIENLQKVQTEKCSKFTFIDARFRNLNAHYKNAEQDKYQKSKLIIAHRDQYTTESHLTILAENEDVRYKALIKDIEKEYEENKRYEEATAKEIDRIKRSVETITEKTNWAKQGLIEWRQAMAKGEEINDLIDRFCKEDRIKADSLDNKRRILLGNIVKQRKTLLDSYQQQKSLEQTLARTAEMYRQAHGERRNLVNTWKEAVNQMNEREKCIQTAETDLDQAIEITTNKKAELKEQIDFLNLMCKNNKEVELAIDELNTEVSRKKKYLDEMVDLAAIKQKELEIAKLEFQAAEQQLQNQRQRIRQIVREKSSKDVQFERFQYEIEELEKRFDKFKNETMSAKERCNQLEELIQNEEKIIQQINSETSKLDGLCYRSQLQINKLKDEEGAYKVKILSTESTIKTLKKSIKDGYKIFENKTHIDYDLGFRLNQLEIKIARHKGHVKIADPAKEKLLLEMRETNNAVQMRYKILQAQMKEVDDDLKKLQTAYNSDIENYEKMNSDIKEHLLYYEASTTNLKKITTENQEKLVELSLLKMKVNQMEKQVAKHDDKVYSLEKHRAELEKIMNERLVNINSNLELLIMKRRHLTEEISTLRADLADRRVRIDALKSRFELASELLGRNQDGSMVSLAQMRIEAAQLKQILLQQGNELNEKVIRAENEIKAMENTLLLINCSNDLYRRSFEKPEEETPELIQLREFHENYCKLLTRMKAINGDLNKKSKELEESVFKNKCAMEDLEELQRNRTENNEILLKVHKELKDQQPKIHRAERELKCAVKSIRQRFGEWNCLELLERELELRELEEKNAAALQLFADLVDSNCEFSPVISSLLYEKNIELPTLKRIKCTTSWKGDISDKSLSESSLRIFSASSKGSLMSFSTSSSKAVRSSSSQAKIVTIDFPMGMKARADLSAEASSRDSLKCSSRKSSSNSFKF